MQKLLLPQLLLLEEACEEARKSGTALNDELRSAILLRCIGGQLIFFFRARCLSAGLRS